MKIELTADELKLVLEGLIHAASSHRESMALYQPFEDEDSVRRFQEYKAQRDECFRLHQAFHLQVILGDNHA